MKQLLTLIMAGSFLASAPVLAYDELSYQGNDEMSAPADYDQLSQEEMLMPPGHHPGRPGPGRPGDGRWGRPGRPGPGPGHPGGPGWGRGCPPGTERRPEYRWDRRHRRWVHVGWKCERRGHHLQDAQSNGELYQ